MKLKQLRDQIAFEAKLSDSIDALGGWLDTTMQEMFDSYTAQIKYQELYMQGIVISLPNSTGIIPLPNDLQHLDLESIRFRRDGDSLNDYTLFSREGAWGDNVGHPRFIIANSSATNTGQLSIWPTDELTANDDLVINYWRHAISEGVDESIELIPQQLVQTVKLAMIARATLFGSSKQYSIFKAEAAEAHSRSLGATNLSSTNG